MKQDTLPNGQDRQASPVAKRTLFWIGLGLLAVTGAVYLVRKWRQRQSRTEVESALPVSKEPTPPIRPQQLAPRPQRLVAPSSLEAKSQTSSPGDESGSEPLWASLPVILLGTAIIMAIITALLLLFLERPSFFGLELDLPEFGGSAFRTYEQQPLPIPVLQRAPAEDVTELTAQKIELLNSYGWVSEEEGIAHIPIERAMRLLLERGLPAPEE